MGGRTLAIAATTRKRILIWSGATIAVALVLAFALWRISKADCFVLVGEVTCRVETAEPVVALTLDDGPVEAGTEPVLAILERAGVRATFFLVGRQVERQPELVRRIVAAGHEVANHSYTHRRMIGSSEAHYEDEIARTAAALRREGARGPLLFRPPFGKKLFGLPRAVARLGHRMIMWDVGEPDLEDPRAYAASIVERARPGSIILMHVMYRNNEVARQALPLVIDGLRAKGLRVVTVGELLARERQQ